MRAGLTPRRTAIAHAVWLAASVLFLLVGLGAPALAQSRGADVVEMEAIISPITERYLARAIEGAGRGGAEVIVVELDTPGGLLDSTRGMVEDILASPVPIVVYVSPSGGRAASAGTFITAAAHIAAMAPATNIGAASPVSGQGEELPETVKSKVFEDAAAEIRAIAEVRGRPVAPLEATVLEAKSYTASEALELGIIDHVVAGVDELLAVIDGAEVVVRDGQNERAVTLATAGLFQRQVRMGLFDRILSYVADPNISFLLISLGSLGLFVEIWNPGLIFPGVVGLIALVVGLMALGSLPGNWAGIALILLAFAPVQRRVQCGRVRRIRRAGCRKHRRGGYPALLAFRHAVAGAANRFGEPVGHRAGSRVPGTEYAYLHPRGGAGAPGATPTARAGAHPCGHGRPGVHGSRAAGQGSRTWRDLERPCGGRRAHRARGIGYRAE